VFFILSHNNNDVNLVEESWKQQASQQKANEVLLAKLTTGKITVQNNKLFKRKLLYI
jgi:hypothetical protein